MEAKIVGFVDLEARRESAKERQSAKIEREREERRALELRVAHQRARASWHKALRPFANIREWV